MKDFKSPARFDVTLQQLVFWDVWRWFSASYSWNKPGADAAARRRRTEEDFLPAAGHNAAGYAGLEA